MYADKMTDSMRNAISETNRRRGIQEEYNELHGIVPRTIIKKVHDIIHITESADEKTRKGLDKDPESMSTDELLEAVKKLQKAMKQAASDLQFEAAAALRDEVLELKKHLNALD
jgi:excinuclease ABC subunit B